VRLSPSVRFRSADIKVANLRTPLASPPGRPNSLPVRPLRAALERPFHINDLANEPSAKLDSSSRVRHGGAEASVDRCCLLGRLTNGRQSGHTIGDCTVGVGPKPCSCWQEPARKRHEE
jgi:hypothetical protein